jgi:hypothetical protein
VPLLRSFTLPFPRSYPTANIRVSIQNAFDIQQGLEDCAFEVVFTYLDEKSGRNTRTQSLYTEEYELLIRKGTFLSGQRKASWRPSRTSHCVCLPLDPLSLGPRNRRSNDALTKTPHASHYYKCGVASDGSRENWRVGLGIAKAGTSDDLQR